MVETQVTRRRPPDEGRDHERRIERMFDRIASPYDRLNRVISLGRDRRWRREAVVLSGVGRGDSVADLGTGTGDLGLDFAAAVGPSGRVAGCDLAQGMLREAGEKRRRGPCSWYTLHRASAARTGLPKAWADVVSMGWVLRNVADRQEAYAEIFRILKPGGRFVSLDMSRPRGPMSRAGFWFYRHVAMPGLAFLSGGDRSAYRYLATSTDGFPDGPALAQELRDAGFTDVVLRPLMLGSLAIHVGTRP